MILKSSSKYQKTNYPKIIDYYTVPIKPAPTKISGYELPKQFKAFFMVQDQDQRSVRNWSVEILIDIGDEGTPTILEMIPRGLTYQNQLWLDGSGNYIYREEHGSVLPVHLEILQKHYRRFLKLALEIAIQVHVYKGSGKAHSWTILTKNRDIPIKDLSSFGKEVVNTSSKRRLTKEFLSKILKEHEQERKRAEKVGGKFKGNSNLANKYLVEVKTIESWVARAKKVSAKSAGSKTKGKGNAKRKKK